MQIYKHTKKTSHKLVAHQHKYK